VLPFFRIGLRRFIGGEHERVSDETSWVENMATSVCDLVFVVFIRKDQLEDRPVVARSLCNEEQCCLLR
jgi:hypothetical protein